MKPALLSLLEKRANDRGLVLASEEALLAELRVTRDALRTDIRRLHDAALIEILTPLPFLVARLKVWSGKRPNPDKNPAKQAGSRARDHSYSFQSSLSQSKQLNESYSYRHTSADEPLLREILETLGVSDPSTFRGAIQSYSPEVIRAALERVRKAKSVRKNPTALFRYLLPRISSDSTKSN